MKAILFLALVVLALGLIPLESINDPTCIKGEWIIEYKLNTSRADAEKHWNLMANAGVEITAQYDMGDMYRGFAGKISDEVITYLQTDPMVARINCDCIVTIVQQCDATQSGAPSWGIARCSHEGDISDGIPDSYTYHNQFSGNGIMVYVLDTGVFVDHADIRGRATWGANFAGGVNADRHGHGSHCAGTVGGTAHGIAKQVLIRAVKVLNDGGSGQYSWIISGINWVVTDNAVDSGNKKIISMSLGGTAEGGLTGPIRAAITAGVIVVAAAGNSNANACNFYPAGIDGVVTVAATDTTASGGSQIDVRASFSNWGTCVEIFAPGDAITSIWWDGSTRVLSGTSMSCPHVSGEMAVIRSRNPNSSPDAVLRLLQAQAQQGIIQGNIGTGSPNLLLYNGC